MRIVRLRLGRTNCLISFLLLETTQIFKRLTCHHVILDCMHTLKTGDQKRSQFTFLFCKKLRKYPIPAFNCILSDYVAHEIKKGFWKNSHLENRGAGFLLRCQNSKTKKCLLYMSWSWKRIKILSRDSTGYIKWEQ